MKLSHYKTIFRDFRKTDIELTRSRRKYSCYSPKHRVINVHRETAYPIFTFLHEYGHALDKQSYALYAMPKIQAELSAWQYALQMVHPEDKDALNTFATTCLRTYGATWGKRTFSPTDIA